MMVRFPICGERNKSGTGFSLKHEDSINTGRLSRRYRDERELCFGVPVSTRIWVLLFGIVIVVWGVSQLVGLDFEFWPLVAVVFGLVILVTALRRPSRR